MPHWISSNTSAMFFSFAIVPKELEKFPRRGVHAAFTLHRLHDNGRIIVFVKNRLRRGTIVERRVVKPGEHRAEAFVELLLCRRRQRAVGTAVKAPEKRKNVVFFLAGLRGPFPGKLDGRLNGLGAAVAENTFPPNVLAESAVASSSWGWVKYRFDEWIRSEPCSRRAAMMAG